MASRLTKTAMLLLLLLLLGGCITIEKQAGDSGQPAVAAESATSATVAEEAIAQSGKPGISGFNVKIDLPKTYQEIMAGDELWFTTKLLNLANQERRDVALTYQILDSQRRLQYSKHETVAVETQASFVARLQTPKTLQEGMHFLQVTVSSSLGQSEAETTFNVVVEEAEPRIVIKFSLFDIQVEIPEKYKTVYPGSELLTSIKLINVGSGGRIDIFLDYWITDEQGTILLQEKETVVVETQNNFVRIFDIPDDTDPGRYIFHAKVSYPGLELEPEYATTFTIAEKKINSWIYMALIGSFILLLGAFLVVKFEVVKSFFEHRQVKRKVYEMVKERQGD